MKITGAAAGDTAEIAALWQSCGLTRPWNDPIKDFAFALNAPSSTVLAGRDEQGSIIASVMVGHDGHRGAIYYLAVASDHQRKGLGRAIHDAAIDWLKNQGMWKINLMVRSENLQVRSFYEALGYRLNDVASFGMRIE